MDNKLYKVVENAIANIMKEKDPDQWGCYINIKDKREAMLTLLEYAINLVGEQLDAEIHWVYKGALQIAYKGDVSIGYITFCHDVGSWCAAWRLETTGGNGVCFRFSTEQAAKDMVITNYYLPE